jgi:hypothetical protein
VGALCCTGFFKKKKGRLLRIGRTERAPSADVLGCGLASEKKMEGS